MLRDLIRAFIAEDEELKLQLMNGIIAQKVREAVAQATPGAKNHTGTGSDTQAGANKAKTGPTGPAPRTDMKTKTNAPAKPGDDDEGDPPADSSDSSVGLKDKGNADKVEARLKTANVQYTRTSDKNGVKFQFKDKNARVKAAKLVGDTIDKSKEDESWA